MTYLAARCAAVAFVMAWAAACGTAPVADSDEVLAFVPEDVRSLVLVTPRAPDDLLPWKFPGVKACAIGGRHFTMRGASMEGDCEAVWVWEALPDGPPPWWREQLEAADARDEIAGIAVYSFATPRWGPKEDWLAVVDDRFLVRATRRSLLETALRRSGPTLAQRRERLLAPDAIHPEPLVLIRVRDDVPGDWPEGLEAFALCGSFATGLTLRARTTDAVALEVWLAGMGFPVVATRRWGPDELDATVEFAQASDPILVDIAFHRLFGFRVFL